MKQSMYEGIESERELGLIATKKDYISVHVSVLLGVGSLRLIKRRRSVLWYLKQTITIM